MNRRTELLPGVFLTCVQSEKFKTGCLSISLLRPLRREEAAANALLPAVLLRGCEGCPDMREISAFLDGYYGASVGSLVRKKGEVQTTGFYAAFLEDRYALDGEPILAPMVEFVCRLLLHPVTENGAFVSAFVDGEKQNLINTMEARINNKRSYVVSQLLRTMCKDEAYGLPRLGDVEEVEPITAKSLYDHYRHILARSRMEIFYHGSCDADTVADLLKTGLSDLPRGEADTFSTVIVDKAETVQTKREALDVTQGKLAMGFRTGADAWDEDYPALTLVNAVYGGTTTSKLFMNVRERLSLCYYASSGLMKYKDVMLVSSGVEFDKVGQAQDEILAQLKNCQEGQSSDDELEWARRSVVSTLMTTLDAQSRLEDYWLGQSAAGLTEAPDELAERVEHTTREQVTAAARKLTLDTVYFLKGKE